MEKRIIRIEEDQGGQRLEVVLADVFLDLTRSRIQKLIESGNISVNEILSVQKNYRVKAEDIIYLKLDKPVPLATKAEEMDLDIIYEDDFLLLVDKQKGMVVHPGPGNYTGTLVNGLLYHCKDNLSSINGIIRPGIVHRLDKDTSGIMLVAKDDKTHKKLAEQFEKREIKRLYKTIVYNNFKEEEGIINSPIARDVNNRLKMKVDPVRGKEAITSYKVLKRFGSFTFLEVRLETGRTHQIRVHMASIKHPVLGDQVYGPRKSDSFGYGQILHAETLGFVHPAKSEYVEYKSPLPEYFLNILNSLEEK